jgi:hypothetical protein
MTMGSMAVGLSAGPCMAGIQFMPMAIKSVVVLLKENMLLYKR